ncbi:hypothetical protein AB0J83_45175 [Actinoplanes sp. NPDC049596]|uniref:hypothetical protein n=1 Tax=unclassified Actinoplanes TaxID=2626549 RepID=UPI003445BB54
MTRTRWIAAIAALAILLAAVTIIVTWLLRDTITAAEKAVPASPPPGPPTAPTTSCTPDRPRLPRHPDRLATGSEWTETTHVFGDRTSLCNTATCPHPYLATMNGCANQRFLIRWRSTDAQQKVTFAHGTVAGDIGTIAEKQFTQPTDTGWAEPNCCGWPLWKTLGPNAIADVAVSIQQWTPTA